jgi:steroid 5-alpha reductase family enzyme
MDPLFILMGTSLMIVLAWMLLLWSIYFFVGQVRVIEWGWGIGFIIVALVCFVFGEGYVWRRLLLLTIISIWALRLTIYLAGRYIPGQDDPRYLKLLEEFKYGSSSFKALTLFIIQGVIVVVLSLPFYLMSQDRVPFFTTTEIFGLLIWGAGVVGETIADRQLSDFKKNTLHQDMVCEEGLWNYSRHPNYFFDWIVWIGFSAIAFSAPLGWLGVLSPILMIILLFKLFGIPQTEAQALEKQGEAYRHYQATTSIFFPWFKKSLN